MIKDILEALNEGKDLRQNIALLRTKVKETNMTDSDFTQTEIAIFIELLGSEDAKLRKNAALLIGELQIQEALPKLFEAYEREQQLFVLSSYVTAMNKLDCRSLLQKLKEHYLVLQAKDWQENEKKHKNAEKHALAELLLSYEEKKRHTFTELNKAYHMLLVMEDVFAQQLSKKLTGMSTKVSSFGLWVSTNKIETLLPIKTYREILFELPKKINTELRTPEEIAKEAIGTGLIDFLYATHSGDIAFTFRVEIKSKMPLDQKSILAKKTAQLLEEASNHKLINSTSNYEFELRLLQRKDGTFYPFLKLYTLEDKRFTYRKNAIATSLNPSKAAAIIDITSSYLKEGAQVLDPFCGVGTLLIERAQYTKTSDMYGVDIYAEAILKARENTQLANLDVNYINRDFLDFSHAYLFDEIITELPTRGRKTKEEFDQFHSDFFKKAIELLKKTGIMILYSNERNFIKKQLRIHDELQLKREICVQEKDGYYIFIIGFKG